MKLFEIKYKTTEIKYFMTYAPCITIAKLKIDRHFKDLNHPKKWKILSISELNKKVDFLV